MTLDVRPLTYADSKPLVQLIQNSYGTGIGMWFADKPSSEEAESVVANKLKMMKEGSLIDNVATINGSLIGDCEIVIHKATGIIGMTVEQRYSGIGVGHALLVASLKKAFSLGITSVIAEIAYGNHDAEMFFAKNGFLVSGSDVIERNGKSATVTRMEIILEK